MVTAGAGGLGLLLGSFAGVVIDRVPAGRSVIFGRSSCSSCGRALGALDLAPVAGYLLRRGRCAGCGAVIPARYPLMELGSAVVLAAPVAVAGPVAGGAAGLAVLAALTGLGVAAGRHRRRPGGEGPAD